MHNLVTRRTQHLEIGWFVATALRSRAAVVYFQEACSSAAWCFAAVVGADHGSLASFRWNSRAVGLAGFLDDGIALHDFG